jgi:hypothetical protein
VSLLGWHPSREPRDIAEDIPENGGLTMISFVTQLHPLSIIPPMGVAKCKQMGSFGIPLAILIAAATSMGFGQYSDPGPVAVPGLTSADAAFVQAVAHASRAGIGKLLDADFTWTDAGGTVQSRAQVLRQIPTPLIPANAKDAGTRTYAYGNLGDIQVSSGRAHILRVWVKRSGGWKAIAYQEVMSRDKPPTFTPGAGKECGNPCKTIPFVPQNETERQVVLAYSRLETAAHTRDSAAFGPMVANEFVAVSSSSDKLQTKRSRMEEFDRSKDGGLAPTPLLSARMFVFADAVLMISEHKPDRGNPLHVTRVWVKRGANWVETLSYQTAATVPAP